MKNNFHIFRENHSLKIQENYCFLDTESTESKINTTTKELKFKIGCAIFYKYHQNKVKKLRFIKLKRFWNSLFSMFDEKNNQITVFAHNTYFDFKMIDGFNYLLNRDFVLVNHYVRSSVFILRFIKYDEKGKEQYILNFWDTFNYVKKPLSEIAKSVNLTKLDIDFDDYKEYYLRKYCMNDAYILYVFIRQLLEFLEKNNLSKLKPTSASLSLNIFRHKFYNIKENSIEIHDWKKAIQLERNSYKGGITDVFITNKEIENVYKTDINSEYAEVMKNEKFPTKLVLYQHEASNSQSKLFRIYNDFKNKQNYGFIMKISYSIPEKYAYLLYKEPKLNKCLFVYGNNIIGSFCTPELEFIEKYGKINHIYQLNMYEMSNIFENFITFFYKLKKKYSRENKLALREFTKMILTNLYGKFGQKDIEYKEIDINSHFFIKYHQLIVLMLKEKEFECRNNCIVYLGTIINECELYLINHKLYSFKQLEKNSKDSFVAISSFTTSYARMLLIKYLLIAKRENVFYVDTDSLFLNQQGFKTLLMKGFIHEYKLGKLKLEGFGKAIFYNPKFYDFTNYKDNEKLRKCKGVKKKSKLLEENKEKVIYESETWNKMKSDLKNGILNKQLIETTTKEILKTYNKGIVKNHVVYSYNINDLIH